MGIKKWTIQSDNKAESDRLQQSMGLSKLVCDVLLSRGLTNEEEIRDFLGTEIEFESPFVIKDMDRAVERIHGAMTAGEAITIYGDYDCDGITATALLMNYLEDIGANVNYYIPQREREGYGLNNTAIDQLNTEGTQLIVTVDNGITAHDEVLYAKSLGIDMVITDHHTPRETLPQACAVVNPHRADCPSHFKELAGVGVAFKLVCALEQAEAWEMLELYSDIVAIGTVADVVSLRGENRAIVRHGLEHLPHSVRPGIQALLEQAGISVQEPLKSSAIAFGIAPRLNAAGRIGNVADAVELLVTDDPEQAQHLAEEMQNLNVERRGVEEQILQELAQILCEHPCILEERIVIVNGEGWHPGVMGIVASRLLERYGKPCMVFSKKGDEIRGSGRSLEGFDLIRAIHACSNTLLHYGGHAMAAGATLLATDLPQFTKDMQEFARVHYETMPIPTVYAAAELTGRQLTIDTIKELAVLGPFGADNEIPLFALKNITITGLFPTRDGNHMRVRLSANGNEFTAIYFRVGEDRFPYEIGSRVDVMVELEISTWNGEPQLSVRMEDIRKTGLPQDELIHYNESYQRHRRGEYGALCKKEELLPNREQLALVYRLIREKKCLTGGEPALYERLLEQDVNYAQMCIALDAFEELGLIAREGAGISLVDNAPKVDLTDSPTLRQLSH